MGHGKCYRAKIYTSGYKVAMLARREDRLAKLENDIKNANAYPCDVANTGALTETLEKITKDLGGPSVVIHNAVSGSLRIFMEIEPSDLEKNFQVNTMALLHLARLTLPKMIEEGHGSLICIGNTCPLIAIELLCAGFAPTQSRFNGYWLNQ